MRTRFLIERDITMADLEEALRWQVILQFEVRRIANVLAYWQRNPL